MAKKVYIFTPGRPLAISCILVAILAITFSVYKWSPGLDSQMAWMFSLLSYGLLFLVFIFIGIAIIIKSLARIHYLRRHKAYVRPVYYLLIVLSLFLIMTPVWTYAIAYSRVSANMNTLAEFKALAMSCKIESIDSFYNGGHHRATDADAYISVHPGNLYYSVHEKDDLKQIFYSTASSECPNYREYQGTHIWKAGSPRYEQW